MRKMDLRLCALLLALLMSLSCLLMACDTPAPDTDTPAAETEAPTEEATTEEETTEAKEEIYHPTLEEVGQNFGVTRERIRQIENKAIRKLRHPSRAKKIKDFYC